MAIFSEQERAQLWASIENLLEVLRGHPDERHFLLEVLGVAGTQVHRARDASRLHALEMQMELASQELAALRKAD